MIYPNHPKNQHTIARVKMDGLYPVIGYSINDICSETIFLIKGMLKIRTGDNIYKLNPGDILIIPPKTKYRIEGKGEAIDVITPAWDKNQNRMVLDKKFKIKL